MCIFAAPKKKPREGTKWDLNYLITNYKPKFYGNKNQITKKR
jgi:hypothetical protein